MYAANQDVLWRLFGWFVFGGVVAFAFFVVGLALDIPALWYSALVVKTGFVILAMTTYVRYRGWA